MTLAALVGLAIKASISLIVFGLGATHADALYLFRRPAQLVRSRLAMNIIMPLVAVGLAAAFDFHSAVLLYLIASSIASIPYLSWRRRQLTSAAVPAQS